ncbi:hypothetical protein [Afifella sp. IM 167]|uniref:hypothetical protein n=1 Tax=Afifella sp. IM 167 TaxID=2033586 RepID=UPI001CCAE5F0|nr:hypothetical protein [Afifella sp. IM 167]
MTLSAILAYGAELSISQRTLVRAADQLQRGKVPPEPILGELDRDVDAPALVAECRPELVRAALAFKLQRADAALREVSSGRRDAALAEADEALQAALTCTRYDGQAWLRLAVVENSRHGPTARAIEALALSHRTSPYEAWMAEARIPFAALLQSAGIEAVEPVLAEDVRTLIETGKTDPIIATLRKSPSTVEPFFREAIAATEPSRRDRIIREMRQASLIMGTAPSEEDAATQPGEASEKTK